MKKLAAYVLIIISLMLVGLSFYYPGDAEMLRDTPTPAPTMDDCTGRCSMVPICDEGWPPEDHCISPVIVYGWDPCTSCRYPPSQRDYGVYTFTDGELYWNLDVPYPGAIPCTAIIDGLVTQIPNGYKLWYNPDLGKTTASWDSRCIDQPVAISIHITGIVWWP